MLRLLGTWLPHHVLQFSQQSVHNRYERDAEVQRLTDWQWSFLLETMINLASVDARYERQLLVISGEPSSTDSPIGFTPAAHLTSAHHQI